LGVVIDQRNMTVMKRGFENLQAVLWTTLTLIMTPYLEETKFIDTRKDHTEQSRGEMLTSVLVLDIFKGLNQIVLNSPIMDPYRKTPKASSSTQDQAKEEKTQSGPVSPESQNMPEPLSSVAVTGSKWSLPIWVYLLLSLLGAGLVMAWFQRRP
jgi:hypothetical protein